MNIKELNEFIDRLISASKSTIDNEIEKDTFTPDKAIRLSTKIKALNIVKDYINKEA